VRSFDAAGGKLMGVPITATSKFFTQGSVADQHGLKAKPGTSARERGEAQRRLASRLRASRRRDSALADFANYLFSFGGDIFARGRGRFQRRVQQPGRARRARVLREARQRRRYPTAARSARAR
jgi:hypothetical protein